MKYTVTWTDEASDQLCELFMAVPNRSELSRVVNAIERHLALRPDEVGESRDEDLRVVMESHIGILFEILPNDCMVQILHIGWLP